jgi:hypothetical protein
MKWLLRSIERANNFTTREKADAREQRGPYRTGAELSGAIDWNMHAVLEFWPPTESVW